MSVQIIPIVFGLSGGDATHYQAYLIIPQFTTSLICHLQKAAVLGAIHTLHSINL